MKRKRKRLKEKEKEKKTKGGEKEAEARSISSDEIQRGGHAKRETHKEEDIWKGRHTKMKYKDAEARSASPSPSLARSISSDAYFMIPKRERQRHSVPLLLSLCVSLFVFHQMKYKEGDTRRGRHTKRRKHTEKDAESDRHIQRKTSI